MTEPKSTDTKDTGDESRDARRDEQREGRETSEVNYRTTVWMDVGHIAPQAEGALESAGWKPNIANKILVYADSGAVVDPQPDYPVLAEVPPDGTPLNPDTGAPAPPEVEPTKESNTKNTATGSESDTKNTGSTSKSGS